MHKLRAEAQAVVSCSPKLNSACSKHKEEARRAVASEPRVWHVRISRPEFGRRPSIFPDEAPEELGSITTTIMTNVLPPIGSPGIVSDQTLLNSAVRAPLPVG